MDQSGFEHFAAIHKLVSELVRHYNTESNEQDRTLNDVNITNLMRYICKSTLSSDEISDIYLNSSLDSFYLLKLCQDRISRGYQNPQFSKLLYLYNQLGSPAFSDRFIRFLLLLSDAPDGDSFEHPIRLLDCHNILEPSLSPDPISLKSATPAKTLPPVASLSPRSSTEVSTAAGGETSLESYNLLESQLVSDLIENLSGRGGVYIRTSSQLVNRSPQIEVTTSPRIPPSLLRRCMSILPLVCSFYHIQLLTEQMSCSSSGIVCSLVTAVRTHLGEYTEYVSLYSDLETGPRTLRSLLLYLHEPMYCLPRICSLLDSWQRSEETGGALVNLVYKATFSGCQRIRGILCQFLTELMAPLQTLLYRWVCLGEIEYNQKKDFFIEATLDSRNDIWESGYGICKANLLDFISEQLASKILIAGKAVSFMRLVCEEPRENFSSVERLFDAFSLSFETALDGAFENIIYEVYIAQSAHLMRILEHTFQFKAHLRGFQDFFLMGRGDFWESFLAQSKHILELPATHIRTQDLNCLFYYTLRSTTAKKSPGYVTDRLEVELSSVSEAQIGWNVLNLNYILTPPLDTVFPIVTIQMYQSIYRVVLSIRKCEFTLFNLWRRLALYFRQTTEESSLSQLYYTSLFYVGSMLHFVNNIQFYISNLFTSQRQEFSRALEVCTDLDQFRSAHLSYLELLRDRCYLVSPQKVIQADQIKLRYLHVLTDLNSVFLSLMESITLADDTFQEMFSDIDSEFKARQQTEEQIQSVNWGMTNALEQKGLERMDEFVNKMQLTNQAIQLQYRNFNQAVHTFAVRIYTNPVLNLRRLAVNINFNGFYKSNTFT